jgi:transposase-like protein
MAVKRSRRDPSKERLWRETVRAQARSGQTVREFCHERGLAESAFYFWRRELRQRDATTAASRSGGRPKTARRSPSPTGQELFVPVSVAETNDACSAPTTDKEVNQTTAPTVEMTLPSGAVLRWSGSSEDAVAEWIAKLEARLC